MQHKGASSVQELNLAFQFALRHQFPSTEQNGIEKIDVFELDELNTEFRMRLRLFLQSENLYWTSDLMKNEQLVEDHIKNLVSIQEIFKNTSKMIKGMKDVLALLRQVFRIRELTTRMLILKLNGDVHTLIFDYIIKTFFNKVDITQKISVSVGNELENLKTYHDLVFVEVKALKGLFTALDYMQKMEFSNSLLALTKYKKILSEFKTTKHSASDYKEEPLMLTWYANFHVHLTAKMRLYYREILDFVPLKSEEKMIDPNLLVRILEPFETTYPDTFFFLIAKELSFSNPFVQFELEQGKKYKYIQVFKDFVVLFGQPEENSKEALASIASLIDESYELLNSYLNKSMQKLVGKDVHYYFISRIDPTIYLGLFAKNYRGKRLEKLLNKLILIVEILRNNHVKGVMTYHHMVYDEKA